MENNNLIQGATEDEIWQQINQQFIQNPDPLEYAAIIEQANHRVILNIDIDLGGGFEGGYETTTFTAPLSVATNFRFAIHKEHFTDEIGKFFGMQDIIIGYTDFDKALIIKSNDELKIRELFAEESVRSVFMGLDDFTFGITTHHTSDSDHKEPRLELNIETGITDVSQLRLLYNSFYSILSALDKIG